MAQDVVVKKDKLSKLVKALKNKVPIAQVGIFGDLRNATIGSYHEFGTRFIPARSFLRVPLLEDMPKELNKDGNFGPLVLQKIIAESTTKALVEEIARLGFKVVKANFAMAGQGKWEPDMDGGKLLHETGQLQNSINYRVVE